MKLSSLSFAIFSGILVLNSCAKPIISNLENGTYKYEDAPDQVLDVSVSILPLPKTASDSSKPKTFLDLRDSLPHLYMKLMAAKTTDPEKFIGFLQQPALPVDKPKPEKKATSFTETKVRFVFTNLKKYYNFERLMHPNTRLEFLTTELKIPDNIPVTFYNIDRLENEYDDIDLGNLSRDQTVSLNAKLSVEGALGTSYSNSSGSKSSDNYSNDRSRGRSVYDEDGNVVGTMNNAGKISNSKEKNSASSTSADAKVSANGEVGYLNSETIKEAVAVKLKRLKTAFNFSEKKLVIAQRGRVLGDISDNVYVTATLKVSDPTTVFPLDVYSFEKLFDENNAISPADKVLFAERNINYVPCDKAKDVELTTSYEGAIRAVGNSTKKNSGSNALEYDDKVTFMRINKSNGNALKIDKNIYCKTARQFCASDGKVNDYVLQIESPISKELDIFIDDNPDLFFQWLVDIQKKATPGLLSSGRWSLYFESPSTKKRICVVNNAMTSEDVATFKGVILSQKIRTF